MVLWFEQEKAVFSSDSVLGKGCVNTIGIQLKYVIVVVRPEVCVHLLMFCKCLLMWSCLTSSRVQTTPGNWNTATKSHSFIPLGGCVTPHKTPIHKWSIHDATLYTDCSICLSSPADCCTENIDEQTDTNGHGCRWRDNTIYKPQSLYEVTESNQRHAAWYNLSRTRYVLIWLIHEYSSTLPTFPSEQLNNNCDLHRFSYTSRVVHGRV